MRNQTLLVHILKYLHNINNIIDASNCDYYNIVNMTNLCWNMFENHEHTSVYIDSINKIIFNNTLYTDTIDKIIKSHNTNNVYDDFLNKLYESIYSYIYIKSLNNLHEDPSLNFKFNNMRGIDVTKLYNILIKKLDSKGELTGTLDTWADNHDDISSWHNSVVNKYADKQHNILLFYAKDNIFIFYEILAAYFLVILNKDIYNVYNSIYANKIMTHKLIKNNTDTITKNNIGLIEGLYSHEPGLTYFSRSLLQFYKHSNQPSDFIIFANKNNIPIQSGMSGNLMIFLAVFNILDIEFSVDEFYMNLLFIWILLCGEGGHTLYDILYTFIKYPENIVDSNICINNITFYKDIIQQMNYDDVFNGKYYDSFYSYFEKFEWYNVLKTKIRYDFLSSPFTINPTV